MSASTLSQSTEAKPEQGKMIKLKKKKLIKLTQCVIHIEIKVLARIAL